MGEHLAFHRPGSRHIKLRHPDVGIIPPRQRKAAVQSQRLSLGKTENWELENEKQAEAKSDEKSMSIHEVLFNV